MKTHLTGFLLVLLVACSTPAPAPAVLRKVPDSPRDLQILQTVFSPDRTEAAYVLVEPTGIFAFDLDLSRARLKKLGIVVRRQSRCEGLTFQPQAGPALDLKQMPGVTLSQQGEDLLIELSPAALALLKPGGRVQFINAYR